LRLRPQKQEREAGLPPQRPFRIQVAFSREEPID
jgi:hypothetical protein